MTPIDIKDIPFAHHNTVVGRIRKAEIMEFIESDAEFAELKRISKVAGNDATGYNHYIHIMQLDRRCEAFSCGDSVYIRRKPKYVGKQQK